MLDDGEILEWPEKLEHGSPLWEALGKGPQTCAEVSKLLRRGGEIPSSAGWDGQVYALHWLITLALKHGADWQEVAQARLDEIRSGQ